MNQESDVPGRQQSGRLTEKESTPRPKLMGVQNPIIGRLEDEVKKALQSGDGQEKCRAIVRLDITRAANLSELSDVSDNEWVEFWEFVGDDEPICRPFGLVGHIPGTRGECMSTVLLKEKGPPIRTLYFNIPSKTAVGWLDVPLISILTEEVKNAIADIEGQGCCRINHVSIRFYQLGFLRSVAATLSKT